MKIRELHVPIVISATKTHCGECHFQHSEWHGCVLFGGPLRYDDTAEGPSQNRRKEECVKAEWAARKRGNAADAQDEAP